MITIDEVSIEMAEIEGIADIIDYIGYAINAGPEISSASLHSISDWLKEAIARLKAELDPNVDGTDPADEYLEKKKKDIEQIKYRRKHD